MAHTCYLSQAQPVSANQALCKLDHLVTSLISVVDMTDLLSESGTGKDFKSEVGSSNRPMSVSEFFVGLDSGLVGAFRWIGVRRSWANKCSGSELSACSMSMGCE